MASDHEISHGRSITWTLRAKQTPAHIREAWSGTSWIVELAATGTRDGKPFCATHLYCFIRRTSRCDTSLRTIPEALLKLLGDRWCIECWYWSRDAQLHEDVHRYRGKGAGRMATLRTAALNLLRLADLKSIGTGMQTVIHDITALLSMVTRRPNPCSDFESALLKKMTRRKLPTGNLFDKNF